MDRIKQPSLKINYIYNLIYQLLTLFAPFITTPYISRILGANNIGIQSFTASIVSYFTLFGTMGIDLYGQREIAFHQDNNFEKSVIFWNLTTLRCITLLISFLTYSITIYFMQQYHNFFLIQMITIINCFIDVTWFCQGEENFKIVVLRNIFFKILSLIFLFVFVKNKNDLWKLILMNCLIGLLSNLSLFIYVFKKVEKIKSKLLTPFKYLKPVILLFIPQIAMEIYTLLDKSMIGIITKNPYENGCYEQAMKLIKMLMVVVTSLGTVIIPRMSALYANKEFDKIREYMTKSFLFVIALSLPMILGLYGIVDIFVPIFFGNGFSEVVPLLTILSLLFLIIGISNILGMQYLIPTKQEKAFTISVIIGAISNFTMNSFSIPKFGAIGAAISSVIAELFVTVSMFIFIIHTSKKIIDFKSIISNGYKYIIASLVMFCFLFLLKKLLLPSILMLCFTIVLCSLIYLLLLIILKDKIIIPVIFSFIGKIQSKSHKIK